DDYSRLTWVFFLATKDETSGILKSFINGIENLVDHKVKVIRCDNGTEFKNKEMNQFCEMKEVVNTACYVQNRVLVVKSHNKIPYELFHGRTPTLSFMRPFGCPITIHNTIDHLGKFDGKADEGFFVGYSLNSKAFRVFNSKTRIVEENLHIRFSENTPNVVGSGPNWLFDIDALTRTMNYEPIVAGTQSNSFVGTKASDNEGQDRKETEPVKNYILLPLWPADPPFSQDPKSSQDDGSKPLSDDEKKVDEDPRKDSESIDQEKDDNVNSTNNVNAASINEVNAVGGKTSIELPDDPNMPTLEDISIFDLSRDNEDVGAEADMNNLDTTIQVSHIPTTRIHKDHPRNQVIRDLQSTTQTRNMSKNLEEHGFINTIQQRKNHKDLQNCLFACFLSQEEPKKVIHALKDPSWIEAMQEELLQFKLQEIGCSRIHIRRRFDSEKSLLPLKNEATRLFLAYASFKDFMMYQMDVKSVFLYGKIKEDVYVCQPPGFEDPDFPDKVYKVEKALYGLHQAPRAWYETLSTYLLDNKFQKKIDKTLSSKGTQVLKSQPNWLGIQKILLFDLVTYTNSDYAGASLDRKSTAGGCQFLGSRLISWQYKKQTVVANSHNIAEYVAALSCQMANLKFADTHNMVAFLAKPAKSEGIKQIVDFINVHTINYVLTINPTIYTSCIEQFWATVKAKTMNGEVQLQALVDGKKIIITESIVRRDLQLEDAEGVDCLPNATIFEQLTLMGSKTTAWNEFSSTMASAIICLATNPKFNFLKYIFESMVKNLENVSDEVVYEEMDDSLERATTIATSLDAEQDRVNTPQSDEDSLKLKELMELCTNLQNRVIDLEKTKTSQAQEITSLKRKVKRLEKKNRSRTHKLKRLYKVGLSARVESSKESLGEEDASKQGRIDDIDANEYIYLVNVHIDEDMFGVNDLEGDEVIVETEVASKDVNLSIDEVTLAQALAALKITAASTRPKAKWLVIHEEEQATTPIMKKKDQVSFDEQEAKRLQAEFDEDERLAREKDEANVALTEEWNDIQAKIDADYQLAQRLQAQEQEELTDEEKARLFIQFLEKRRKHFACNTPIFHITAEGSFGGSTKGGLLLTPLCCDDIHDVTPRVSALAGCDNWTVVKNILKYLRNTKDMFLVYGGDIKRELRVSCYTDVGYLTDAGDLKSPAGYLFVLNGGDVDWKSTKQSIFATSSAEAE
ncbi:putative ribonuclease H-like domain-containing protein, partial [Tanacetum coccineum]